MDLPLTLALWTGMALRICLGWLIACLRTRTLLPFDERQLPSLATVAALGGAAGFISGWLADPALQPNERLVMAVALGFFAQVIFRDSLKGLDQQQPLRPPTPLPPSALPSFGGNKPPLVASQQDPPETRREWKAIGDAKIFRTGGVQTNEPVDGPAPPPIPPANGEPWSDL